MKGNIFIKRPVMAISISVLILVIGLISLFTLPVEQYPDIAPPTVYVSANYTGADAEAVLNSVIMPLEESINGVENMMYISSTATNAGSATIQVYFKQGNRKYLYTFLHDQTRRIGHRPERLAPHHAAAQRLAAPDGQHGQPGDLHAPVRIDARNAPYSVPANFRVTESSGGQPPPKQCPAGNGTPQERDSNTLPRQGHRNRPRIEERIGEGTVIPGLAVRDGEMPSQTQRIVVDHRHA